MSENANVKSSAVQERTIASDLERTHNALVGLDESVSGIFDTLHLSVPPMEAHASGSTPDPVSALDQRFNTLGIMEQRVGEIHQKIEFLWNELRRI